MGRLIDGTIQALPMSSYILERKETFIRVLENGDNDFLFAMLMDYFDTQPTAYDVDKVVAELEKHKSRYVELQLAHNDANMVSVYVGKEQAVDCAIDIVRRGGVK